MKPLLPEQLVGQKETLFGNMQQIYDFHKKYALPSFTETKISYVLNIVFVCVENSVLCFHDEYLCIICTNFAT